jgi:hypothetical protein
VHVARGVVFGSMAAILGLAAVILLVVGATRGVQSLLVLGVSWPVAVYLSYFIVGGILCAVGLFLLSRRPPPDA